MIISYSKVNYPGLNEGYMPNQPAYGVGVSGGVRGNNCISGPIYPSRTKFRPGMYSRK